MSSKYSSIRNKQQKHPKINYRQYLYNSGEPMDDISNDSSTDFDYEMIEDSSDMRRRFRDIAQRMRNSR